MGRACCDDTSLVDSNVEVSHGSLRVVALEAELTKYTSPVYEKTKRNFR